MRLRILSDVHLEFGDWTPPAAAADVVVIAGDLHKEARGIPWIQRHFPGTPVIYLAGNHEFYGSTITGVLDDLRAATAGSSIHFLEKESRQIGDLLFLGCTLWTDFALFGDPALSGAIAAQGMNDYRQIRTLPGYRRLKGRDTAAFHRESRGWLERELAAATGRNVVILTHHAPSGQSLSPNSTTEPLSAAYASPLDELVRTSGARLWIHGHTHRSVDYTIGSTRILANQKGYPDQNETGFIPDLVVEV